MSTKMRMSLNTRSLVLTLLSLLSIVLGGIKESGFLDNRLFQFQLFLGCFNIVLPLLLLLLVQSDDILGQFLLHGLFPGIEHAVHASLFRDWVGTVVVGQEVLEVVFVRREFVFFVVAEHLLDQRAHGE